MISFNCEACGKNFKVPDAYAGRSAKCKICGNMVKVPMALEAEPPVSEPVAVHVDAAETTHHEQAEPVSDSVSQYKVQQPMIGQQILEDRHSMQPHDAYEDGSSESEESTESVNPYEQEAESTESNSPVEEEPALNEMAHPADVQPDAIEPAQSQSTGPIRIPMRIRRLRADAEAMQTAFQNSPIISVQAIHGDPPEAYRVQYSIQSLEAGADDKPLPRTEHEIEIQLTSEYPRLSPRCKILTPIFHPNFDPTTICVGDHWTAGERLVDLVVRIGEMIGYQAYNIQSPLNAEAAMWADLNRGLLPTDARDMRPADME